MALWGSSRQSDLQSRIDEIQSTLASLGDLIGESAGRTRKAAARSAHSARDTVSESAEGASSAVAPVLHDLRDQLDELLSQAGTATGTLARRAEAGGKQAYRAVEDRVESNPILAVAAAAGVGLLIGAMLRKGTSSETRRTPAASISRSQSRGRRAA